ncbi:Acyl-CoA N-acyltransferase with RING/FYVE/PHD-type zinc finger protein [Rhynchospora pubera]|uniref:Acyl-CoA N-acyltransferase with RING/FYVE/PHD-type zinc finger protein n=1 Tax=Rhynchospora pubera TaxID=906938 RepID=A0AAV8F9U4_9POAL|nr:Acyl-CoA N-acyltransferase with RING/FYVE/PHD-type zinc finger protein [Rhynchospora pubera]
MYRQTILLCVLVNKTKLNGGKKKIIPNVALQIDRHLKCIAYSSLRCIGGSSEFVSSNPLFLIFGSLLTSDVHKFFLCDSCSDANQLPPPCDRPVVPAPSQSSVELMSKSVLSCTSSSSAKKTNTVGRLTRKNTGLHKLVFMGDILPEGTEVAYYVGGKRLLDGYIKDGAIFCHCCMAVVSPSLFEAHAGQASRRKPYNNIYTSNGVSLHELSVSLSKHKMISLGETDDLCSICSDSGDLIVCDFCPRAFHKDCVGLTETPEGDWYCQFCVSLHRRDDCVASNDNARAAGRIEGVDPIEQIFKRCIRIVSISETDLGGCSICKLHDFSKSGFDDRTVILCDQCQREYHVGCLRDHKMADLKELPEGEWFCSSDCNVMHGALKEVILGGSQSLTSSDIELIRRKTEAKGSSDNEKDKEKEIVDFDNIRWRLLSGASAQEVEAQLLSGAVSIFHESFDPIIDAKSKQDLIPAMVNGMSIEGHQDYSGMYCAVLTIGSKVVSAGLLRVFGTDAAELPLVATSRDLQGLGYFQALFGCMERMLIDLKVRHFLLPAAEEAESIWTKKFGFSRITSVQVEEYLKGAHLTAFRGTSSLHKPLFLLGFGKREGK